MSLSLKPLSILFGRDSIRVMARVSICAFAVLLPATLVAQGFAPFMNSGPDSGFAQIDFAQIYMDTMGREEKKNAEMKAQRQHLVDIGAVSALDLDAPNKALEQYNQAVTLMKEQHSKEAILHLQKALAAYPKFVVAHNTLGLAYLDQDDERAKEEFETAAKLDSKFPGSFLNLGMLELSTKHFADAETNLEKAVAILPNDPKILAALAFAQNGDHKYSEALRTIERVHTLEHRGMGNVHYIAAASAMALSDYDQMERELRLFLLEAPTDPLAPVARQNLNVLLNRRNPPAQTAGGQTSAIAASNTTPQTFPNSEHLRAALKEVGEEPDKSSCATCESASQPGENSASSTVAKSFALAPAARAQAGYTIHETVDETALFFAVSSHGRLVSDLQLSDVKVSDGSHPPERIVQFLPQSKLPLRLGLLIDTSGSVHDRFSFEKHAAKNFIQKVLNGTSDLGFVGGFSGETTITRDFTSDLTALGNGIEGLTNGGGTALFDAVTYSCRKLAEYPETGRVALVLVVLSDGEDNSSHRSLKQTIEEAETSGVTIYTLSTGEDAGAKTDADEVLQVLADRSGGEAMFPGDMITFGKSLDRLRDLIRSRYLLAYKPADFVPNGKYRPVHIVAEKEGKHLQVHVRKGYYARLAEPQN